MLLRAMVISLYEVCPMLLMLLSKEKFFSSYSNPRARMIFLSTFFSDNPAIGYFLLNQAYQYMKIVKN